MTKVFIIFFSLALVIGIFPIVDCNKLEVFAGPAPALSGTIAAQTSFDKGLEDTAGATGHKKLAIFSDIPESVGSIIKLALAFVGAIFFGLIFYAGNIWMGAAGNEEAIKKAKSIIINAIIGLLFVITAYFFTNFIGSLK